ncbi:MAG TPA: hypothetical protein VF756_24335 [Thermoanaerobaculia bacterium]
MKNPSEIWRQRLWVWVPALVFFLANATAFTVYRFGFSDRVHSLEEDLDREQKELAPLAARRQELERLLALSRRNQQEIARLYSESFATRSQRLTAVTAEVKSLARKAGLDPQTLTYPQQDIEEYGLVKRSFAFPVEGTYLELRRFINLLELSSSFLTLEEVQLAGGGGDEEGAELRMTLRLSTLFALEPGEAPPAGASRRVS